MSEIAEKLQAYPHTEKYRVVDTIGVPHTFCITPRHLENAGMYLDEQAIRRTEQNGQPSCGMRGCTLMYDEHKQALLIEVDDERDLNQQPELHDYLMSIKEMTEKDGYAGFAFKKAEHSAPVA